MKYKQGDVLVKGDMLVNGCGRYKILGICGEVYLISYSSNHESGDVFYTQKFLDDNDYTLLTEPESVTMKEVCEKFGREVKIIKEQ